MIAILLPWPSRDLHPNARVHWARKAKATKKARADAAICARVAGIRRGDPDIPQAMKVTAVFYPPDNRRRDEDGMLSACKPYFDGISDLMGIDDSKWSISLRREPAMAGGSVVIMMEAQ